jgi:hypothetical protein
MAEDKLSIDERLKVLRLQRAAYRQANKAEKGRILDMLESLTGLHRKSIIRRMNGSCVRRPRRRQRGRQYGPQMDDALRVLHRAYDGICAERLTPNLPAYAAKLAAHGHLRLTPTLEKQLAKMSVSTVRRRLQHLQQDEPHLRRPPPGPRNGLLARVPAGRISCFETTPGHFEADLVHHCGTSASGEYLHTLHLVDVATGWSEMAAILGRSYRAMQDGFVRCDLRLPFLVLEIHPDNGSEFFNAHILRFYGERYIDARISRSRPWHKNDNRFVEHRNGALIRRWLGHDRLDSAPQARMLNQIYDRLWLYHNFFQPVMRLESKVVDPVTSRVRRRWDEPRTPFERVVTSGCLNDLIIAMLTRLYDRTDPLLLRQQIEDDIVALFSLPAALPGQTEDLFATLDVPLSIPIGKEEAVALGDVIK